MTNLKPIVELKILEGEDASAPAGWEKLPKDLNANAGGKYLYLAYRRANASEENDNSTWITNILSVINDQVNSVNPEWTLLNYDLNKDAGGDDIYLTYKKGGTEKPIVNLMTVSSRKNPPTGYTVLGQDLNARAGGDDIFLAYMRSTSKYVTIRSILCIQASSGISNVANAAIITATGALGGAVGALPGALATPASGGAGIAAAVAGGAVGAGLGVALGELIKEGAAGIDDDYADDLYLEVDRQKVWPRDRDSVEIETLPKDDFKRIDNLNESQKTSEILNLFKENQVFVDLTFSLENEVRIELFDEDTISGDDSLGYDLIPASTTNQYKLLALTDEDVGSSYLVVIEVHA